MEDVRATGAHLRRQSMDWIIQVSSRTCWNKKRMHIIKIRPLKY